MSRKTAIDNFCRSCIYDEHSAGTWREQVTECTATSCPLFQYRPLTEKAAKSSVKRAMPASLRNIASRRLLTNWRKLEPVFNIGLNNEILQIRMGAIAMIATVYESSRIKRTGFKSGYLFLRGAL